jgi:DNA-binding LacI/PurR family transcriptional regulator
VVGANNWQGGFIATEYLIQHGHRRIGIIIGPDCYECSLDRRDGYIAALARAAIEVDPELIMAGSFRWEGASEAAERLMSLQTRPTAVFTSSDVGAAALYQVAARRGLRVPDDISVVGFDDVAICTIMAPPLTTIRQPLHEMARAAVRMTEDLSTGVLAKGERHIQLTTTLVERQSVGTLQ